MEVCSNRLSRVGRVVHLLFILGFFTKSSPDFINHKGELLNASKQVDALGQAQSIGVFSKSDTPYSEITD